MLIGGLFIIAQYSRCSQIGRWVKKKKEKVVYLYDGLLLSNKKIRTTDTQNHMDELKKKKRYWKEETREQNPNSYFTIYMNVEKKQNNPVV